MKSTLSKILWLIAFQLIVFNAIGQKDTLILKTNDSLVCVTKNVALSITKDLLKKDILLEQVEYLKKDSSLQSQIIKTYQKDSATFNIKEKAYIEAIGMYKKSLLNCEEYGRKKNKELQKTKIKSTGSQIFLLILSIFVVSKL